MHHLSTAVGVCGLIALAALGPAAAATAVVPPPAHVGRTYAGSSGSARSDSTATPGSIPASGFQMNHQTSDVTTMNGDAGMSGSDMAGMDMSGDTGASGTGAAMPGMTGMDHGASASSGSSGAAGSSDMGGMPGMDHGSAGGLGHGHEDMPKMTTHDSSGASPASHPRSLVIGGFAALNGLVLLAAAFLRRRIAGDLARKRVARTTSLAATATARTLS